MGMDATTKVYPETDRPFPGILESDPAVAAMVDRRWAEYGLGDLRSGEVDPNLFGYDMR